MSESTRYNIYNNVCEYCRRMFQTIGTKRRFCCISHRASYTNSGRVFSDETKRKIGISNDQGKNTSKHKRVYVKCKKENCNTMVNSVNKTGMCQPCCASEQGKVQGPKNFHNQSGRNNPMFGRRVHTKRVYYKNICFRSSWEAAYAKFLDSNGIKWVFECKTFDMIDCTYTPDFYIIDEDKFIEVKGFWYPPSLEKFKRFREMYPQVNIEIVDHKKLKELKVITD